ncbi:hypothetical protein ABPG75_004496 [Micractinium tetrahymenae]
MSGDDDGELKRKYLRWSGELQEAYLGALEQCGGLHEARPKTLLDILAPRFPFLTLQAVKNHLQKQRTKEAKAGGGAGALGARGSRAPPSLGAEDSEDVDQVMASEEGGAAAAAATAGGGVSSRPRGESPGAAAAGPAGATAATAAAAAPAGAAGGDPSGTGAAAEAGPVPPQGWAAPLGDSSGVQPNSLIDLARRALALTVHQLGLYKKLLEELELNERDHAALVATLREDPTGQSIVLEAQRALSSGIGTAGPHSSGTAGGSGASGAAEEGQPLRLRRLLARLLPPNPFSSEPKAEAALKLAAWIAAATRDQPQQSLDAVSLTAASQLGAAADLLPGLLHATRAASAPAGAAPGSAASLLGALSGASGGQQPAATTGAARPAEEEDEEEAMQLHREPHRQRRKRHKPLSELLAEIPLQEPMAAERLAMQHAAPTASELQQLLGGPLPGGLHSTHGAAAAATAAPDAAAAAAHPAAADPLGPALSLLLQQHLQGAPGVAQHAQQAQQAQQAGHDMDLDEDTLMLRALDAQMSSLLLQTVSNALMRSAAEGGHAMDATGGAGQRALPAGLGPLPAAPGSFEAAAAAAAAGNVQVPSAFQAAAAGLLQGDEPLPSGALDISVLRSFLDMLSSGGLAPLAPAGLPGMPGEAALAPSAAGQAAQEALLSRGLSLGEGGANMSGSSGSHGSGGGIGGGAFSAFHPTASGGWHAGL